MSDANPPGLDPRDEAALAARLRAPPPLAEVLGRSRRIVSRLQLIGLLLLIAFGVLVFSCAFLGTSGPAKSATDFLQLTRDRGPAASYVAADPEFRRRVSLEDWSRLAATAGLRRFARATWSSRSVNGDKGQVSGVARASDGRRTRLTLTLTNGRAGWAVTGVGLGGGRGVSTDWSSPSPRREKMGTW